MPTSSDATPAKSQNEYSIDETETFTCADGFYVKATMSNIFTATCTNKNNEPKWEYGGLCESKSDFKTFSTFGSIRERC